MFSVRDNFPDGMKITQIPLSWFRAVSAFLNNLASGTGIKIDKPSSPSPESPTVFSVNDDYVAAAVRKYAPRLEVLGADEAEEGESEEPEGNPVAPSLTATDDSADFTSGGDALMDGDAIDTTNHPDAANDTTRWMNNAAADALGGYDAEAEQGHEASGDWTSPTALATDDASLLAFDPTAAAENEAAEAVVASWRHHVPLDIMIFSRSRKEGTDKLFFARPARIAPDGRLRYAGAETCIARTLDGSRTDEFLSILVGESGAEGGIIDAADTTTTLQDITPTPVQDYPFPDAQNAIQGVVWRAGHGVGYEEAVVTRMKPYTASRTIYVEIGFRVRRYSANGALYEVANEQAWGYVLQAT